MPRPLRFGGRARHIALLPLVALIAISDAPRKPVKAGQNSPPASQPSGPASAGKPAQPLTLQWIRKSWKARQDRTKVIHIVWDTKVPGVSQAGGKPAKDAVFRALHSELWLDGDDRSRLDQGFTGRSFSRIHNGDTSLVLKWRAGSSPSANGLIWSANDRPKALGYELAADVNQFVAWTSTRPVWITFQPVDFLKPPGDFQPVEITTVNGVRCVRFEWRTTAMSHNFCVDPARDDLVLSWDSWIGNNKKNLFSNSIEYDVSPGNVWVPSHWTSSVGEVHDPRVAASTVTACTINQRLPADTFAMTFPKGTMVIDRRTRERYVVGQKGAKTDILKIESAQSLKILEVLDADIDFEIEPQSLKDALDFVAARYQIPIRIEGQGRVDISTEVQCRAPGLTVKELLKKLLDQMDTPLGVEVRKDTLFIVPAKPKV